VYLSGAKPPVDTFVYQVLFVDPKLIAYGEDIIEYFERQLKN
jgi:hypothetical protein